MASIDLLFTDSSTSDGRLPVPARAAGAIPDRAPRRYDASTSSREFLRTDQGSPPAAGATGASSSSEASTSSSTAIIPATASRSSAADSTALASRTIASATLREASLRAFSSYPRTASAAASSATCAYTELTSDGHLGAGLPLDLPTARRAATSAVRTRRLALEDAARSQHGSSTVPPFPKTLPRATPRTPAPETRSAMRFPSCSRSDASIARTAAVTASSSRPGSAWGPPSPRSSNEAAATASSLPTGSRPSLERNRISGSTRGQATVGTSKPCRREWSASASSASRPSRTSASAGLR